MIISLLEKNYVKGYLPKDRSEMIQPIFPTANLAIRRSIFNEVGLFDTFCKTSGEDMDLCIRVAKTKWELFFEPKAIIHHKHRCTLRGLVKQWYGYGTYHPHIFKKHAPKCLDICYFSNKGDDMGWSSKRLEKIFGIPMPFHAFIFLSPFHFLNILLILGLGGIIFNYHELVLFSIIGWVLGWLYFTGIDFFRNVIIQRNVRWLIFYFLRGMLNFSFVLGAFWAGLRMGVFALGATRERAPLIKGFKS
jgi:cellulose synthase/poly-beta-1,6-N-acetylglucosamine synthase-like glycosyltransferase